MTKHYLLSSLAAMLLALPMQAQSGKQITSITHEDRNDKEESTFTYDASGRIIAAHTISTSGGDDPMDFASTFSYDDAAQTISSHTVISCYGEQIIEDAVGTLSNGHISKIVIDDLEPGGSVAGAIFEVSYDGDGHAIKTESKLTTPGEEFLRTESILLWQDGNLVNVTTNDNDIQEGVSTTVTRIHYDTAKPAPKNPIVAYMLMDLPMDVSSMQVLLPMLPYMGFTPRNLATGWDDGEDQVSAAYEYDGDGDISRIEVFTNQDKSDTYIFGHGYSGISNVHADQPDDAYYSLQGHKVNHPKRGIYVRSGRKVVVR